VRKLSNLELWEKVKKVPDTAIKTIKGGRLSGMSDINPMWRLKTLTEQFGMCGVGWKYVITDKRLETGGKGEIAAFVDISLFVKVNGEWSAPIPGTGGSSFVANEKHGPYTSDECFKMALTDAISVACKALGIGADIYWDKDKTKYSGQQKQDKPTPPANKEQTPSDLITNAQAKRLFAMSKGNIDLVRSAIGEFGYTSSKEIRKADYEKICAIIEDKA
jgi:hypothetical protein